MLAAEIHIAFLIYRHQMYVGVMYLKTYHSHTDTLARNSLADGGGDTLGKKLQVGVFAVAEVEYVVHLAFGHNKSVTLGKRTDGQKGVVAVVFGDTVRRNLAGDDFGKYRSHGSSR